MKKKTRNRLIFIAVLLIIAALITVSVLMNRVTMNSPGTIGNTAGNLNNSGLFCEYDGTVYFSNSYDGGALYSMNVNEGNIRKLNGVSTRNILAGGKYLYYFQLGSAGESGTSSIQTMKSFSRCKQDGSNIVNLANDVIVKGQLVNNHLYLLAADEPAPHFYKVKIDKSEQVTLANTNINPACAVNGTIYYNGTEGDHYLYAFNTYTDASQLILQKNIWNPIVEGDYVYYMDLESDYRLCRYSISQDVIEILTEDRVDLYNVGHGYIYYQTSATDNPQLKCMRTDGSNAAVIADGTYTNINMTSQYVYFQQFGNETTTYHTLLGSTQYSTFDAANAIK